MRIALLLAGILVGTLSSPALSATLTPGYATLYDQGINGTADTSIPSLFAGIQKADAYSGTYDREFVGFLMFDMWGISSFSSATLDLTFSDTVTINPGPTRIGIYGQTAGIGYAALGDTALNGSKTLLAELTLGVAAGGFDFSPVAYLLDLTSYLNSALSTLGPDKRVAIRFDVLNTLDEIPAGAGNAGFGVGVTTPLMQYLEGPPPIASVPVPAALPLLGAALAVLGLLGWGKRLRGTFAAA